MTKLEERRAKIENKIPDKNLRHIIFNFEDTDESCFLSSDDRCLDYFSNVMTFSVLLIWNAFLKWKKNTGHKDINGNNSFWRLYNILDRICDPTKINEEIIDDVLINFEIDCLLPDDDSMRSFVNIVDLDGFFNFKKDNTLAKYIGLVKQMRVSSRISDSVFTFDTFCASLNMFSYLSDTKVSFAEVKNLNSKIEDCLQKIILDCSEIPNNNTGLIDFCQSIYVGPYMVYYMEDFYVDDARRFDADGKKNQSISINYIPLDGGGDHFSVLVTDDLNYSGDDEIVIKSSTAIEEFLLNYDIINTYKSGISSVFFRDYILLNNRYLKELSYTISDALSVHLKDAIRAKYPQYKELFDKMYVTSLYDKKGNAGYRWDEIVLFLLLEEGVQEFFRVLLHNGGTYESFVRSFERRLGNDKIGNILKTEKLNVEDLERRLPPGSSKYTEIDCFAKALVMLATKALTQNDWALEESFYPTTIADIISECEKVNASQYSKKEKIVYFSNVILQVVHFLNKFYRGVFKYASEKKKSLLLLETSDSYDGYKQYNKEKEDWIKSIAAVSGDTSEQENRYFTTNQNETLEKVREAFARLIDLNNSFSSYSDNQSFETLGRKSLFVSDKMRAYVDSITRCLSSAENCSLSELYGEVKHFLLYLKTGLDDAQRETMRKDLIEMSIYPIVGQYCSGITSFDGYRYSLFRTSPIDDTDNSHVITIKMITDDGFDFGHSYYCIPNINRIANVKQGHIYDKIWVSPIIIPCSAFLSHPFSNLERLSESKDYPAAIELIYASDPFIYGKLFESLENAKIILPELLNNPDSKFYKDHYRIIRKDGQIVAIASIYSYTGSFWDYDLILKGFLKAGITPPASFSGAIKDLKESFVDDYPGRNYYHIDDVCVKEEYRNRGIGRSLMMGILKTAEKNNMSARLFVYSENYIAYRLYSSLGFFPIKNQFTVGDGKEYFQMVKI